MIERNADLVLMDRSEVVEDAWFPLPHGLVIEMREYVEDALRTDAIVPLRNGEFGLRATEEADGSFAFSIGHAALTGVSPILIFVLVKQQEADRPKLYIDTTGLQMRWLDKDFLCAHGKTESAVGRVVDEAMYVLPDLHRAVAFAWWDYVRHDDG